MEPNEISRIYGDRIRLRVCGILVEDDAVLLVKHKNLGEVGTLWIPPGGGVENGQSLEANLKREFKEETGLDVKICDFLFLSEFLRKPLHAIEMFFSVKAIGGELKTGIDPEVGADEQIIEEVKMMSFEEINRMNHQTLHGILRICSNSKQLLNSRGFFNFENNL